MLIHAHASSFRGRRFGAALDPAGVRGSVVGVGVRVLRIVPIVPARASG
jgi:hypothetical protein